MTWNIYIYIYYHNIVGHITQSYNQAATIKHDL